MTPHRHKAVSRIERGFSGPVESKRPNPKAHGWLTVEYVCGCGAQRFINENGVATEVGHWESGDTQNFDDSLYDSPYDYNYDADVR